MENKLLPKLVPGAFNASSVWSRTDDDFFEPIACPPGAELPLDMGPLYVFCKCLLPEGYALDGCIQVDGCPFTISLFLGQRLLTFNPYMQDWLTASVPDVRLYINAPQSPVFPISYTAEYCYRGRRLSGVFGENAQGRIEFLA